MFLARDTPVSAAAARLGSVATRAQQAVEAPAANVVSAAKACVHATATQPNPRDPSLESPLIRLQHASSSSFLVPGWPHDASAQLQTSRPGAFPGVNTRHQTPEAVYSSGALTGVPPAAVSCMPPPPPPPPRSSAASRGDASRWDLSGSVLAGGYKIGDDAGRTGQSDATYRFVDGLRSFEPDCPVHSHLSTSAHGRAMCIPLLESPVLAADSAGISVGQRAQRTSADHAAFLRRALCGSKRQALSPAAGHNAGHAPAQKNMRHAGMDRDCSIQNFFLEPQDIGLTSLIQPGSESWVYHGQDSDSGRPSLFFDSHHHTPFAHVNDMADNSRLTPAGPARVGQDCHPSAAARQQTSPTVSLAAVSDMRRPREDEAVDSAPPATRRRTEQGVAGWQPAALAAPPSAAGTPVQRAAARTSVAPEFGAEEAQERIQLALLTIRFALAQSSKDNGGPRTRGRPTGRKRASALPGAVL
ncbi:hypothetical protein HK405_004034 [Cladochytrium tenue]|nr:hypothetical protein HK405_004034 [Cladochytrium tenue]